MRKKVHEAVVSGEAWASAVEKIIQYGPTVLAWLAMTGAGTWVASNWNALSGQGWGVYPLVGALFALVLAAAFALLSVGKARWKASRSEPVGVGRGRPSTRLLMDAFERHAAEEAHIVYLKRNENYEYIRFDDVTQKHPMKNRGLTEKEYFDWLEFLENFLKQCAGFELPATVAAIETALNRFKKRNINLEVAYWEYQRVSDAFKNEAAHKGLA